MISLNFNHNLNINPLLLHKALLQLLPPQLNLHLLNPLQLKHIFPFLMSFIILSAEILALQTQQSFMMASQSALLNNQSLLMEHFMNMQLKMNSFEATQLEILDHLKTHFHRLLLPDPTYDAHGVELFGIAIHGFGVLALSKDFMYLLYVSNFVDF